MEAFNPMYAHIAERTADLLMKKVKNNVDFGAFS